MEYDSELIHQQGLVTDRQTPLYSTIQTERDATYVRLLLLPCFDNNNLRAVTFMGTISLIYRSCSSVASLPYMFFFPHNLVSSANALSISIIEYDREELPPSTSTRSIHQKTIELLKLDQRMCARGRTDTRFLKFEC
jgi:hypothetical protein